MLRTRLPRSGLSRGGNPFNRAPKGGGAAVSYVSRSDHPQRRLQKAGPPTTPSPEGRTTHNTSPDPTIDNAVSRSHTTHNAVSERSGDHVAPGRSGDNVVGRGSPPSFDVRRVEAFGDGIRLLTESFCRLTRDAITGLLTDEPKSCQ